MYAIGASLRSKAEPVGRITKKNCKRANVSWKICIICFFTLSLHLRTMKWKLKRI